MKKFIGIIALSLSVLFTACAPKIEPSKIAVYKIATRQLPPEETYSRLKWVRPPQVLPAKHINSQENKNQIFLITHFDVKNMPLNEAILVFSAANRYKSNCKKSIANKRITLSTVGTMHEIARKIEKIAGIQVLIDHNRKTVRFL